MALGMGAKPARQRPLSKVSKKGPYDALHEGQFLGRRGALCGLRAEDKAATGQGVVAESGDVNRPYSGSGPMVFAALCFSILRWSRPENVQLKSGCSARLASSLQDSSVERIQ